ncbi:MAG TPA: prephenate dehydratase domain-containing protein [Polyangiaceae bacterium]
MTDRRREVAELRRQMAEVDQEVLRGILQRARLARKMGELETHQPGSIPPAAERDVLIDLEQQVADDLPIEAVRTLFRAIHEVTSAIERPSRIACAGPEGSFAQLAARHRFGAAAVLVSVETPEAALDHVQRRRADFAVFPFESTTEGPLQASVEALSQSEISMAAKVELTQTLSLMSKSGRAADVANIYGTSSDRSAAQKYLSSLPRVSIVDARSPLAACQMASEDSAGAALVPEETGEHVGLVPVQANVSDKSVHVRYAVASGRPASRSGKDTTSIIFGVHDQPGALFDVLRHFAERGINLETIQSRPMLGDGWNYLFYVELTGHVTDRSLVTALEEVKRQTRLLKVLGSYPSC